MKTKTPTTTLRFDNDCLDRLIDAMEGMEEALSIHGDLFLDEIEHKALLKRLISASQRLNSDS